LFVNSYDHYITVSFTTPVSLFKTGGSRGLLEYHCCTLLLLAAY